MQSGPKGLCKVGLIKVQELRKDVPSRAGAMWAKQGLCKQIRRAIGSQREPERAKESQRESLWLSVALCGSLSDSLWHSQSERARENICGYLWLSVALCGSLWLSVALCGSLSLAHSGALSSALSGSLAVSLSLQLSLSLVLSLSSSLSLWFSPSLSLFLALCEACVFV